jgi:hypothetical protein
VSGSKTELIPGGNGHGDFSFEILACNQEKIMESYRKLIAWQKAKELALEIYPCTRGFPKAELYGLADQARLGF